MSKIYVGVGERAVTNTPGDVIRLVGLGSHIGVLLYSIETHTAAILHVAFPKSEINPKKALLQPGTFADTGVPMIIHEIMETGVHSTQDLSVKLVGGAIVRGCNEAFSVGGRTHDAIINILKKYNLNVEVSDLGGSINRTVSFDVSTGRVVVSSPGKGSWVI